MSDDLLARHLGALGLLVGSSISDVEQAYRDLARVWHPDRFESDQRLRAIAESKMREINVAHDWLRAHADLFGKQPSPKDSGQRRDETSSTEAASRPTANPAAASATPTSSRPNWLGFGLIALVIVVGLAVATQTATPSPAPSAISQVSPGGSVPGSPPSQSGAGQSACDSAIATLRQDTIGALVAATVRQCAATGAFSVNELARLGTSKSPSVQYWAIWTLGQVPDEAALPALMDLARSGTIVPENRQAGNAAINFIKSGRNYSMLTMDVDAYSRASMSSAKNRISVGTAVEMMGLVNSETSESGARGGGQQYYRVRVKDGQTLFIPLGADECVNNRGL